MVSDIVRCCFLERAPAAVDAALQCIIEMAALPALQVCASDPSAYTVHTQYLQKYYDYLSNKALSNQL